VSDYRTPSGEAKLLVVKSGGAIAHLPRSALANLFGRGDLVVANDAATLPASLRGVHIATGAPIEVRLAGWESLEDPTRFTAVVFGAGDHRTRTEDRPPPPPLEAGDGLQLGPLTARISRLLGHPRLVSLRFAGTDAAVWAGLAPHGRPIQYAHAPEPLAMWDTWTGIAARPVAFEAPSAGFALDWRTIALWKSRGVLFATLTLAAGISSTGDPALDARLPLDEPYIIPGATALAIHRARDWGGRVIAVGTTAVRALEAAARGDGFVQAGEGVATGRIGRGTSLKVADAILSGVHEAGESHFELLRAFAPDRTLDAMSAALKAEGYRNHEFGDSVLIERLESNEERAGRMGKAKRAHAGHTCHPWRGERVN
jgi:S-adenosylmethionine:tRNA ribosyltransferase-isomerase